MRRPGPCARSAITGPLARLDLRAHDDPPRSGDREITAPGSTVRVFAVEARDDLQLAAEARARLGR